MWKDNIRMWPASDSEHAKHAIIVGNPKLDLRIRQARRMDLQWPQDSLQQSALFCLPGATLWREVSHPGLQYNRIQGEKMTRQTRRQDREKTSPRDSIC